MTKYNSVSEMMKEFDEKYKKEPFYVKAWDFIRYRCMNIWEFITDTPREIRWKLQRANRGYSDRDVWSFDYYLSKVISRGVKDLHDQVSGWPGEPLTFEEWKQILKDIEFTFKCCENITNSDYHLIERKQYKTKKQYERIMKTYEKLSKEHGTYIMTLDDIERYNRGWDYFRKFYFNLWD